MAASKLPPIVATSRSIAYTGYIRPSNRLRSFTLVNESYSAIIRAYIKKLADQGFYYDAFQPDKLFLFCCGKSVNVADIERVLLKLESPFSYLHQKLHKSNTCLCFVLQAMMLQRLADEEEIVDNWGASSYFTDCTECPYVKSSFEFTCCNQIKMICGYCFCKKLEPQFDIDVHNDVHSATDTLHFREEKNPESTDPYITCPYCKQGLKFRPI